MNTDIRQSLLTAILLFRYSGMARRRHSAHAKGRWHSVCFELRVIYGTCRVNLIIIIIPGIQYSSFVRGKHLSNKECVLTAILHATIR